MKRQLLTLCLFAASLTAFAQNFNMTRLGGVSYPFQLSNLWGWTAPNGVSYALVGTQAGFSMVSLADPTNPIEVDTVRCTNSIWREIKTFGHYAYVVSEVTDGVLIVDLSTLPNRTTRVFRNLFSDINGTQSQVVKAHANFIDERGRLFLSGTNANGGAIVMYDLATDPWNPRFLGAVNGPYCHDSYVRGDTLYSSDIYAGDLNIYNISNPAAPVLEASQRTPSAFTHNAWLSDNGSHIFTTDEKAKAFVAAYDISDFGNISETDRWQPYNAQTTNVIPHNTHVLNDYAVTAFYTDGVRILDVSRPTNMVEVAHYDTYGGADGGFRGCWGVFPYLPNGLCIASDMQTGLHVFNVNYQRACWLEGRVRDASNGAPIFGANIDIQSYNYDGTSDLSGNYAIGTGTAGIYTVVYSAPGYVSQTFFINLRSGIASVVNANLVPITSATEQIPFLQSYRLHENPFTDFSGISFEANGDFPENVQLKLYDVLGRIVETHDLSRNQGQQAFGNTLQSGIYFVSLSTDGKSFHLGKVVKQ